MFITFLLFCLNIFSGDNQKIEIYTNDYKYFHGEIPKNCNMSFTLDGVEIYNNQKLTAENTLIITHNGEEVFRKIINATPYTSNAIQRYIGYDNGWAYTFFLRKKSNSFQDTQNKEYWNFESSIPEQSQIYNVKVINNGNGKILYESKQELSTIDFLKCIIQPIGKARDCNDEIYDTKKGIILGAAIQIHTYKPKTKLRKNIETGLKVIGLSILLIAAVICLTLSVKEKKTTLSSENSPII